MFKRSWPGIGLILGLLLNLPSPVRAWDLQNDEIRPVKGSRTVIVPPGDVSPNAGDDDMPDRTIRPRPRDPIVQAAPQSPSGRGEWLRTFWARMQERWSLRYEIRR